MDSRHDFTLEKVFWGYFGALDQKANSALPRVVRPFSDDNTHGGGNLVFVVV